MSPEGAIRDPGWAICVAGFRGAKVGEVESLIETAKMSVSGEVQLFDSDMIAGREHLYFAAVNAIHAFETGQAISNRPDVEVALYASCQDQISRAFSDLGISPSTQRVAAVVMAESEEDAEAGCEALEGIIGERDDSVLDVDEAKFERLKDYFGFPDEALEAAGGSRYDALTSLIIERGAILPTLR